MTKEQKRHQQIQRRKSRIHTLELRIETVKSLEHTKENKQFLDELKSDLSELVYAQTGQKQVHRTANKQRWQSAGKLAYVAEKQKRSAERYAAFVQNHPEEAAKVEALVKNKETVTVAA